MNSSKTRHINTIISNTKKFIKPASPNQVRVADEMSKHFVSTNYRTLAAPLNNHPPFQADGLSLEPDDLDDVKFVRDLVQVMIDWYEENGWTIVS